MFTYINFFFYFIADSANSWPKNKSKGSKRHKKIVTSSNYKKLSAKVAFQEEKSIHCHKFKIGMATQKKNSKTRNFGKLTIRSI